MKKLFVGIYLILALASLSAQSQQSDGTLSSFLAAQGLAGAKLERRLGNHLMVPVSINNKRGALMIDTGAPITLIDKNSAATFGLKVENTARTVGGVFGTQWERYGMSMLKSIAMGNCVLTNVPVALSDESRLNAEISSAPTGSHIPASMQMVHINGLLGSREMRKFGMIIDCTRQMLYVNPNGPSALVSQKLAAFLAGKGFTRVPMRLNSTNHFDVQGALNAHPTRFIVDSGAGTTVLGKEIAVRGGVLPGGLPLVSDTSDGHRVYISGGEVNELAIGDFKIAKAQVDLAPISGDVLKSKIAGEANAGLLGEEYLSFNFAVIDIGGMGLYLRHADVR
jgi:predicted aspartyl protease